MSLWLHKKTPYRLVKSMQRLSTQGWYGSTQTYQSHRFVGLEDRCICDSICVLDGQPAFGGLVCDSTCWLPSEK